MTGVLWILAILSIVGGFIGWPAALGGSHPTAFQRWLEPVLLPLGGEPFEFGLASHATEWLLMLTSVAVALVGILLAWRFYQRDPEWALPRKIAARASLLHKLLINKYWVDELYNATAVAGTLAFSRLMWWIDTWVIDGAVNLARHITVFPLGHGSNLFDKYVVDGLVNGVANTARGSSRVFRKMQSGVVQNYALVMGGGIVLIAVVYLFLKPQ
jgi:NADH-quinone oxidoreductase subunit L